MKIGLIDVDGHNFPNLALMKLSAWHKSEGDTVEWHWGFDHYDRVYKSKVFDCNYTADVDDPVNCDEIICGGTGYGLDNKLPAGIEHTRPDYSLYPELTQDTAYGFLTRGCPRGCEFCIVSKKEGYAVFKEADLSEWWNGQKYIKLLDPNITACRERESLLKQLADSRAWVDFTQGIDCRTLTKDLILQLNAVKTNMIHFAWDFMKKSDHVLRGLELYAKHGKMNLRKRCVYVLVNFDTTMEENLYRVYKLREMDFDPYVMIYDKPNAPQEVRHLQRWANNKIVWRKCERFEDYDCKRA